MKDQISKEKKLGILIEVGMIINSTYDVDTILKYLVDVVKTQLGYDVCSILLREEDFIVNKAGQGLSQEEFKSLKIRIGEGITGTVAKTGKAIIVNDVASDERYIEFSSGAKCLSEMAVPIIAEDELIGVFNLEDNRKDAFTEEDLQLIKALSDQAAIAIRNAQTKESMDFFNKRLLNIYETVKDMTSTLKVERVLSKIVTTVANVLNCEMVVILLRKQTHLEVGASHGFDKIQFQNYKIKIGQGITGTVADTGIPEIVGDVRKDSRYIPHKREMDSVLYAPIKSEICIPIKYKRKIIGVLNAESDKLNHFTHDDLKFLTALGDQSGIAIENARYYERIQNFNEELRNKIDRATSQLKNANLELQRLNKIKSDFVGTVSHELRTPMTSIMGYISVLHDEEVGSLTAEQKEFLGIVIEESNRLTRLISDLLDISKIESGKMNVPLDDIDFTSFIHEYRKKIEVMTNKKKLMLTTPILTRLR